MYIYYIILCIMYIYYIILCKTKYIIILFLYIYNKNNLKKKFMKIKN